MRRQFIALLVLAAVAGVAACAQAHTDEGTKVLGFGDHYGVEIDNSDGGSIDIEYDVKVDSGPAVDVYFMEDTDYDDVLNDDAFEYYIVYSVESTRHANKDWTWTEKGVFYVVIINMDLSLENATVTYKVGHEDTPAGTVVAYWVCGALIVIGIIILPIVLRKRRRKRAAAAMTQIPPMQPGAPYPAQGQVPPPPGPYQPTAPPPGQYPPPPPPGPYPPPPGP